MSAHAFLKSATRADHDALDAHFSGLNLADDGDYALFLTAHAAAFLPTEQALAEAGADTLAEWSELRRSDALKEDLAVLGLATPQPMAAPDYASHAAMLGGAYVLEGSRLGGKLLRRQLRPDQPSNFLSPPKSLAWRDFIAHLEQMLSSTVDRQVAANAAQATFACFAEAARVNTGVRSG